MLRLLLEKDSFSDTPQDLIQVNTCALCPTKTLIAVATEAGDKPEEDTPKIKIYRFNRDEWKLIREEKVPQGEDDGDGNGKGGGKQRQLTKLELMRQKLLLQRQQRLQKAGNAQQQQQQNGGGAASQANSDFKKANTVIATSLAWRPDGLGLACGHSNGTYRIYGTEQSEAWTPSDTGSKEPVVSMFWSLAPLEEHKRVALFQNEGIERFFPGEERVNDGTHFGASYSQSGSRRKPTNKEKESGFPFVWDSLDMLFCLDKKWNVYIFSCGQFLVGKVNCGAILGPEVSAVTPVQVQYSAELRSAVVLGHNSEDCNDMKGASARFPSVNVVTFSTEGLSKKKKAVSNVSRLMWGVNTEASKVHAIVEKCVNSWKKVSDLFMERRAKLEELLEEHSSKRSPEEDFLAFLAAGELSPAMEQFIPTDIQTFHDGIEKGLWSILGTLRFSLPQLLEHFYLFVLEAQKGEQSSRFAKLDGPIIELGKKVKSLTETIGALNTTLSKQFKWLTNLPRNISEGLSKNVGKAQEKWPSTNETKFIAESIQYGLDTVTDTSVEWMNLSKVTASLLALTKETMKSSILGEVADISDMDSYTLETPSKLPEEVRICHSPPIILLGDTASYMYMKTDDDAKNTAFAEMMLLDDDDDDCDNIDDEYFRAKTAKEPTSINDLLLSKKVPTARDVIASWSQKRVRTDWGEGKVGFGCLGTDAHVIDYAFIWGGNLVVLYTLGELKTYITVLKREGKDGTWKQMEENTLKVPDDAKRVIGDEESGRVIVSCASERTQIYTTKQEIYY